MKQQKSHQKNAQVHENNVIKARSKNTEDLRRQGHVTPRSPELHDNTAKKVTSQSVATVESRTDKGFHPKA